MPPSVFSLDEHGLRFASFRRKDGRLELHESGFFAVEEGAFFDGPLGGPLRDVDAFESLLAELVQGFSEDVTEASLVLPDRWLRLAFAEITELPESKAARLEALRFKLRRLVPFRVEDLRLTGVEVTPLAGQAEPRRVLLSFAVHSLLEQLELVFEAAGVRIGLIANSSVCLAATLPQGDTVTLLQVTDDGYSLLVTISGEPVLYRHKALSHELSTEVLGSIVARDLTLTRTFLDEKIGGEGDRQVWIAAREPWQWSTWIEQGLASEPLAVTPDRLPLLAHLPSDLPPIEGAPLIGAALQEVA